MKRALILDCGQAVRSMVAYVLGLEGFEVREASSLSDVRDVLESGFAPDIAIACKLPKDGVMAFKSMKTHSALKNVPLLLVAEKEELKDQMEWKEAGITCWLTKPFTPGELLEMVRMMLFSRPDCDGCGQ